jgi:hypothetical protein
VSLVQSTKTLANQPFPVLNERTTVPLSRTARKLLTHVWAINIHRRNQMSDEIKKPELVNAGEEKQLDSKQAPEASEEELSKAVGGAVERLQHSLRGPDDTLDQESYSRPFPPIRR